ncbi:hypothetical protein D3C72_1686220 [compost metagenome]
MKELSHEMLSGERVSGIVTMAKFHPCLLTRLSMSNSSGNPGLSGSRQRKAKVSVHLNSCARGNPFDAPPPIAVNTAAPTEGNPGHSLSTSLTNSGSGLPVKDTIRYGLAESSALI